jgi:ATP/ADP translocase
MIKSIRNILRIRAGEGRFVLILGAILLFNTLAMELGDVVAVAGFLKSVDVSNILILWVVDMILVISVGGVQSLIVDRFSRLLLLRGMCLLFAVVFGVLLLLFALNVSETITYGLLFLLVEQQNIFLPLVFWILASELLSAAQSRRLFPVIASFSAIGQIMGLSIAAVAPLVLRALGVHNGALLLLNITLYLLSAFILTVGLRRADVVHNPQTHAGDTPKYAWTERFTRGFAFIREIRSLRYLTIATFCAVIVLTIIDYHFLVIATRTFSDDTGGGFQTFYGAYRLIMTVLIILVQNLITNRLIERYGIKNALLAVPIAAMAGALFVLVGSSLFIVASARALIRLVNSAVDLPAQKAFLSIMPEDVRGAVSIFTDGYSFAIGAIIASVVIGAVVIGANAATLDPETVYLMVGLLFAIVGIIAVRAMYRHYDMTLFNWRLKRRQRTSSVLKDL